MIQRKRLAASSTAGFVIIAMLGGCAQPVQRSAGTPTVSSSVVAPRGQSRDADPASFAPVPTGSTRSGNALDIPTALAVVKTTHPPLIISTIIGVAPSAADWQGTWLYLTVQIPQSDAYGAQFDAGWQSQLVVGAVAELANNNAANLGDVIAGYVVTGQRPDGTQIEMGSAATGDVVPGEMFAGSDLSTAQIVANAETSASKYQMTVGSVQVLHADGPAPDIQLVETDPGKLTSSAIDGFTTAMFGPPSYYKFAGFDLEIDDKDGNPLYRRAVSARTGTFSLWQSPEYTGGVSHSRFVPPLVKS